MTSSLSPANEKGADRWAAPFVVTLHGWCVRRSTEH